MSTRSLASLDVLMHPRSVAIMGASTHAQNVGGMPVRLMREFGFQGRIVPVHPEVREIQGLETNPLMVNEDGGFAADTSIQLEGDNA